MRQADKSSQAEPGQLLAVENVAWLLGMTDRQARAVRKEDPTFPTPMMFGGAERWLPEDIAAYIDRKHKAVLVGKAGTFELGKLTATDSPAVDVPEELLSVKDSVLEYHGFAHPPCVYFLLHFGTVVYVGKTQQLGIRIGQHVKGNNKTAKKEFNRVLYIVVGAEQVGAAEAYYIQMFNPIYNRVGVDVEA